MVELRIWVTNFTLGGVPGRVLKLTVQTAREPSSARVLARSHVPVTKANRSGVISAMPARPVEFVNVWTMVAFGVAAVGLMAKR